MSEYSEVERLLFEQLSRYCFNSCLRTDYVGYSPVLY